MNTLTNPFKKGDLAVPTEPYIGKDLRLAAFYRVCSSEGGFVVIIDDSNLPTEYHHTWLTPAPKNVYVKQYFQC